MTVIAEGEVQLVLSQAALGRIETQINAALAKSHDLHVLVDPATKRKIEADLDAAVAKASATAKITPTINASAATKELGALEAAGGGAKQKLESVAAGAATASTGTTRLSGALKATERDLAATATSGGRLTTSFINLGQAAGGGLTGPLGVAGLAVAGLGVAAVASVDKFIELATQVRNFELVTGASAEQSSQFVVAMRLIGVDSARTGQALFRLGHLIGDAKDQLAKYHIEVVRGATGNVNLAETFLNVSDAVKHAGSGAEGSAIAFAAFGRQGVALLPVLARGRDGLQSLFNVAAQNHEILSQADVDRAIALKIQIQGVKEQFSGLGVEAAKKGLPLVSGALTFLTNEVRGANRAVDLIGSGLHALGTAAGAAYGGLAPLAPGIENVGHAAHSSAQALQVLAAEAQATAAGSIDLEGALSGVIDAQSTFDSTGRGVASAQRGVADAQYRVNELLRQGAVNADQVHSAQEGLDASSRSLTKAQSDLAKAQQHLIDVEKGASPRDLEQASLRTKDAQNALLHAEISLTDVRKNRKSTALEISDAEHAVEQATIDQANAQDALTAAQKQGTDGAPDYVAAQDAVVTATQAVKDAQLHQADAASALRKAQAGDVNFAHNLADARAAVADAEAGVATATEAHTRATLALEAAKEKEYEAFARDAGAVDTLRLALLHLQDAYPGVDVSKFFSEISKAFPTADSTPFPQGTNNPGGDPRVGLGNAPAHRARGGPVQGGRWYEVNEGGREYFRPDSSGQIYPVGPDGGKGGGDTYNQTVTVNEAHGDPNATAQAVAVRLGAQGRR